MLTTIDTDQLDMTNQTDRRLAELYESFEALKQTIDDTLAEARAASREIGVKIDSLLELATDEDHFNDTYELRDALDSFDKEIADLESKVQTDFDTDSTDQRYAWPSPAAPGRLY
jgi:uncharacterized coiled-coil DUF342 family protein